MRDTRTWTDEMLIKAAHNSNSIADILRKLHISTYPGNYRTVKKYINLLKIDTSHFKPYINAIFKCKIKTSDILVKGSSYHSYRLKNRLIKENLLDGTKCSICNKPPTWNNKPLILILDHINGDHFDNRLENLRLLCPNCNSQLDTNCGKNKKTLHKCLDCGTLLAKKRKTGLCLACIEKIRKMHRKGHNRRSDHYSNNKVCSCGKPITNGAYNCPKCFNEKKRKIIRPNVKTLQKNIKMLGFVGTGKLYGVSDNAIRKWIKT